MTRDDLLRLRQNVNVDAFLHVIREGESSNDESAYTILNGGEHFEAPPWEHPNRVGKGGASTAAGAYQNITKTWRSLVSQYGFEDFSPQSQDLAAVALIAQHGAIDLILAGRPLEAIRRINSKWIEWECFENPKFLAQVPSIFAAYGGVGTGTGTTTAGAAGSTPAPQTQREVTMAPLIPILIESLVPMIPQLAKLFGSGTEVSNRNNAALEVVADQIVKATNAVNLQDAVSKAQADPQVLDAVKQAVSDVMFSLVEVGGGVPEARKSAYSPDQVPFYRNPAFIIAGLLSPLIYMVAIEILFNPSGQTWSDDIKMMFVTAIVSGLLGSITGFFLGSSLGSQKKDAALSR